jgi:hypothetical protein
MAYVRFHFDANSLRGLEKLEDGSVEVTVWTGGDVQTGVVGNVLAAEDIEAFDARPTAEAPVTAAVRSSGLLFAGSRGGVHLIH